MSAPRLVSDINHQGSSFDFFPVSLTAVGSTLFFVADDGITGPELWRSDGTNSGTRQVADIHPGDGYYYLGPWSSYWKYPRRLTAVGDTLYFVADVGDSGEELWKSDGTNAGTVRVSDINPGEDDSGPSYLTAVGDTLFFTATDGSGYELWKSDGTEAGTFRVSDINYGGSNPRELTVIDDILFFAARSSDSGQELWKSDGTSEGTNLVSDINVSASYYGAWYSSSFPESLTTVGSTLFFVADDGNSGKELWKSDGTSEGTVLVSDIDPGSTQEPAYYGYFYYTPPGEEIPNASHPQYLTAVGNILFFTAETADSGRELWKSDGTEDGTVSTHIRPDFYSGKYYNYPSSYSLAAAGDTLFFAADDGNSGKELWKSDGTQAGTIRVSDINPGEGDSYPSRFTAVGDTLYFAADDGNSGEELWKSDGTQAGTIRVSDINPGEGDSYPRGLTLIGDTLFFTATDGSGYELWALDLDPDPPTPSLAFTTSTVENTEGNRRLTRFEFTVTRTGDLSGESSADWAVTGAGDNHADPKDFAQGVLPSGTIRFRAGQSACTFTIRVRGDRIQEFDEKFEVNLSNSTAATISTSTAIGVILDDDLIGTSANDTITGSQRAEYINGLAGQDSMTGQGGSDRFGFVFGQSRIRTPDHITDFHFGQDSISLVNKRSKFRPIPQQFSRAADNSTAATHRALAESIFVDADGLTQGNQALTANSAVLVHSTNLQIAGTYLLINDGNAGLRLRKDLLIDITGFSGSLPDLGTAPADSVFN